ncbi:MAG: hypothetical protein KGJ58_01140 [Patescibacteria group bacterium]|nr:hypothetical protein [Patescibacteria group bacterium]MDE2218046.1 hypothetical protein [Patescibacteria group bacterium]
MKKTIIVIVILLIAGAVFWMFKSKTNTPATETTSMSANQSQVADTDISTINKDIDSIDVGNTDQEFNDVNKDLQGL